MCCRSFQRGRQGKAEILQQDRLLFARRLAQPAQDQHEGHPCPRNLFSSLWENLLEEAIQFHAAQVHSLILADLWGRCKRIGLHHTALG